MKQLLHLLALAALLVFAVSCDDPITQSLRQQEARAGLKKSLDQLPIAPGLEMVNVQTYDAQVENDRGTTCYYATGYVILGASVLEKVASDLYVKILQQSGWTREENRLEVLARGMNERVVVEYGPRSDGLEKVIDEAKARGTYRGVIVIRVVYILPARKEC